MKNINYVLLVFLLINSLSVSIEAQSRDRKYYEFLRSAKTSDLLQINDSIVYLMNKSPLEKFSGYKDLYSSYKEISIVEVSFVFGTEIQPVNNTRYQVIWCLRDGMLYLSDINFYSINNSDYKALFPDNEQYKLMEKLTEVNFDKTKVPLSGNPFRHRNTIGMMPAKWLDDTILIKKARKLSENTDQWIGTPCEELVFKGGKLISMCSTDIY